MKPVYLALVVVLLLSSLPPAHMYLKVSLHTKTKSLSEHLTHARRERDLHRLQVSSSDPDRVTLEFKSSHYIGNLTVGTPPQNFSVVLNTLITGLWIPSALCPTNEYDVCKNHRQYDRNASTTYEMNGQTAGLAGMLAKLSLDTVSLADISVTNQSFAEVIKYRNSYTPVPYDGLLGLGLSQNATVFYNDSSLFKNMVLQNLTQEMVYGVYLIKNGSDASDAGGLIVGGRNKSLYAGDLTYVDSMSKDAWEFEVTVLLVNSEIPKLCDGCRAVPNSASRFIATNHRTMDTLHKYLGAIVFADDYTYQFNCSNLADLQTVYLSIGHALFRLPWQSYVDILKGSDGKTVCVSTFVGLDDINGYDWYLGEPFFASVYVEFDIQRERVGFAQSIYSH